MAPLDAPLDAEPNGHRANIDLVLDSQQQHRETAEAVERGVCRPSELGMCGHSPR
jgi:hypothetical protein